MTRSSSKRLSLEWTKGLEGKEKESMEEVVRHSTMVLQRLLNIVDDKLAVLERKESDFSTYENPAYPIIQGHINGKRASLEEIRRLLEFIEG